MTPDYLEGEKYGLVTSQVYEKVKGSCRMAWYWTYLHFDGYISAPRLLLRMKCRVRSLRTSLLFDIEPHPLRSTISQQEMAEA